ncbi:GntR family transcriptional regulator [Sneathiella sp. CAU 1612]|uniref:GntR family transcriptional regulator n=1 Tax=Sneathiella sedimenti TaxID=2816034 RepID=A0ABS3F662_9PROT|nr:GntR family transcriptional regulator [Sneathiella sedimenti]MBO0333818.1 GntR family transcriptional regulator [Sneathiella sedimenti]
MATSRANEILPVLEQDIVTGTLKPGTRLDETILAEKFGVSRTPIREALNRLSASGLVEIRPRRGAIVAAISVQDLMNMFEVMAELEALCARLAARRITPPEKAELRAAHDHCHALSGTEEFDEYYERNLHLHTLLYKASHNIFLEKQACELRRRLSPHRRLQVRIPGRILASSNEHGALVEAVISGDAALAEKLTRDHVTIQGERFTDFLSTLPPHYLRASA